MYTLIEFNHDHSRTRTGMTSLPDASRALVVISFAELLGLGVCVLGDLEEAVDKDASEIG